MLCHASPRIFPAALCFATVLAALPAQQRVVPSFSASLEGNSTHAYPLSYTGVRMQILLDASAVSPGPISLTSLAFRGDGTGALYTTSTLRPTLTLYTVPATAATMSTTWATNIGAATGTIVFQTQLSVPAFAPAYPTPNPFAVSLTFSRPYVLIPTQGNLLMDWHDATTYVFSRWNADAVSYPKSAGSMVTEVFAAASCKNARGDQATMQLARSTGALGTSLDVSFTFVPSASNKLDLMVMLLGDTNQKLGGAIPLPLDLTAAGYPQCALAINPLFSFAGTTSPLRLPVPNNPGLDGAFFFLQGIAADTSKGVLVPTTTAWQVQLVGNPPLPQTWNSVYRANYMNETTGFGSPTFFYAPVLRFN